MTEYYGFTIKCIKQDTVVERHELEIVMKQLISRHKAQYVQHYFEHDSMNRLHIHGTFMARKGILLSLFKKQFWTIHIDYLKTTEDVAQWSKYIQKDQCTTTEDFHDKIKEECNDYFFI